MTLLYSMTGYAIVKRETAEGTITVELKSVNARFLDLQFRIHDDLHIMEPALRSAIVSRLARGKVECRLSFERQMGEQSVQKLNAAMLKSLAALQAQIRQQFADVIPFSVHELLSWPGVMIKTEATQDILQHAVLASLQQAIALLIESRAREGTALQAMLLARIDAMETIINRLMPLVPQLIVEFQQKVAKRMQEALGFIAAGTLGTTLHEETVERIRQEVILYGMRIDIAEELVRLSAHVAETRRILAAGSLVGRRLDFMLQELNREANTIGSKAANKELADAAMELKLLIDQMREQVQNLE